MTDFENKPAAGVPGPREGAGARPGGGSRETVLLGDDPDVAPHRAETVVNTQIHSGLATNVLAALGQRYEILGEAGHGSMGNVYKARDRETGETVALKLLKPEIASDQAMMDRFKNELLFARKITHKNVCRVYEFNRAAGIAYTSMEFVEGESLRSVLNRFGALTQKKAKDLALQICSGLKEAHAQGIVHRDLKPENVMIDGSGNLKIMDFGIARSMEARNAADRRDGRHARLHGSRAGLGQPRGLPHRHLFAGFDAVRNVHRQARVQRRKRHRGGAEANARGSRSAADHRSIDSGAPRTNHAEVSGERTGEKISNRRGTGVRAANSSIGSRRATLPSPAFAPAAAARAARPAALPAGPLSIPSQKSTAGRTLLWILFGSAFVLAALAGLRWLASRQSALK